MREILCKKTKDFVLELKKFNFLYNFHICGRCLMFKFIKRENYDGRDGFSKPMKFSGKTDFFKNQANFQVFNRRLIITNNALI